LHDLASRASALRERISPTSHLVSPLAPPTVPPEPIVVSFDYHMPLDRQRTLFIGMPANAIPVRTCKFFDSFNVSEFQIVAWKVETFVSEIQKTTGQPFEIYHHSFIYRRFKEMYDEKIAQLLSWIKDGHVFVIFPYSFSSGPQTDGKNGVVTIDVNQFPPLI
jgi:hypothetical protein